MKVIYTLLGLLIGTAYYHGHPIWGNWILVAWIIFFAVDEYVDYKKALQEAKNEHV